MSHRIHKPAKPTPAAPSGDGLARLRIHPALVALFLALATLAVYWPVTTHEFISYDDPAYVTDNPMVRAGLSGEGVAWAFTRIAGEHTYWHPLTWLSHMLDCQIFGLNAGAHHAVNLLFHTLNVVLLFLLLRAMTRVLWPCAFVAALFALHPLQVDTVAWVAERKNVLSTFFAFLSLLFYVRFAESKIRNTPTKRAKIRNYLLALMFFAFSLMSKPMLVTLPFVMLLLDFWPLKRFSIWRLIREKIPFLALSAASSLVTILAHQQLKMVWTVEQLPFSWRLERVATSYLRYFGKVLWPDHLAIFYPIERHLSVWQITGACLVLVGIILWALWRVKRSPYLAVGWFWFLGTLVPVIGLLQVGNQSIADRFTYVPDIGVFLMVTWGASEMFARWHPSPARSLTVGLLAVALLAACALRTRDQLSYWQNSGALFSHAIAVTKDNFLAYNSVGGYLKDHGREAEAAEYFRKAVEINPNYELALNNIGCSLAAKGSYDEAIRNFRTALRTKPDYADALGNLGMVLIVKGNAEEAIQYLRKSIEINPGNPDVLFNLGTACSLTHRYDEAIVEYHAALALKPEHMEARLNLGDALLKTGKIDDAITQFQEALRIQPDRPEVRSALDRALTVKEEAGKTGGGPDSISKDGVEAEYNLGCTLATSGRRDEAVKHLKEALRLKPDFAPAKDRLRELGVPLSE